MLKSQLINFLKMQNKDLIVKIYTFDPDLLWHETDEFEIECDSIYKMDIDKFEDILCIDISSIYKKQTVSSVIKTLSQEKENLDVCLLVYDDKSTETYQFNYISNFSVEIKDDYILISV